ncbi:hypothetical protein HanRHA438_Chr11g0509231 [Helianthus annuus]|nr:hypothetical protein HanRHA438_Chr11g0509231 [Helianthus annuus]
MYRIHNYILNLEIFLLHKTIVRKNFLIVRAYKFKVIVWLKNSLTCTRNDIFHLHIFRLLCTKNLATRQVLERRWCKIIC